MNASAPQLFWAVNAVNFCLADGSCHLVAITGFSAVSGVTRDVAFVNFLLVADAR